MKKTVATLCAVLTCATGVCMMGSCGDKTAEAEKTVMNVSLNPSVEFVLDGKNKVVSVNALNEEGNLVVSAENFIGKDMDVAVTLFVEVSKETGFLVSGNAQVANNAINVSFSGDAEQATELYNKVSAKVGEYLSKEKITATVQQAAAITEEKLEALVTECAPYIEAAKVQAMEYAELVEVLYESRKETAEMYSQELKNAYYEAKAFAMEKAELEVLKSQVTGLSQIALDVSYKAYEEAVNALETLRMETLVDAESEYQKALAAFREAKADYLAYRAEVAAMEQTQVTETVLAALVEYENVVNAKEEVLLSIGEMANDGIDAAKTQLGVLYDAVVKGIEDAAVKVGDFVGEISDKQKAAQEEFFTAFETNYAEAITAAKNEWANMKGSLEGDA